MDIHSILVEYFIDDPNDLIGYMNDAYSLIAGECIKKNLNLMDTLELNMKKL